MNSGAWFSPTIFLHTDELRPYMNSLAEEQNSQRFLDLAAAKSHLYSLTDKLQTAQIALLVFNALVWPPLLAWKPNLTVWSAFSAFVIPLAEVSVLEPLQQRWKVCAAKIQEQFDCTLFRLVWNDLKVGPKAREENIARYASAYRKHRADDAALRDWYSFDFSDLPVSHARLICQRANAWWDTELRSNYSALINWSIVVLSLLALITAIATGLTVEKFILAVVAPLTPICLWALKETKKQSRVAAGGVRVVEHLESAWASLCNGTTSEGEVDSISRSLQDEIFERRSENAVNPQWLYGKKREQFQKLMIAAANQLLSDYRAAKTGQC